MATALGQKNVRLGIPRVNQNPQPPHLNAALSNRIKAPAGPIKPAVALKPYKQALAPAVSTAATSTSQASNIAPAAAAGSTTAASVATPVAPAPTSGSLFTAPTWTPKVAGEPDPRDATYWQNLSKLTFNDQTEYAKDLQEQTVADTSYAAATQQAIQARSGQERALGESAIKSNLGSSGWLDRTQGEQTRDYTQERANASLTKSQEDQARLAARNALAEGFGIEAAAELAAAAGRFSEARSKEAENGAGESAASAPGPSGSAPTGPAAGKFQFYQGPNQLPGGNVSNAQPAKAPKQALSKAKKAR